MAITVKYFAALREEAGKPEESVEFVDGMTVSDVWKNVMSGAELPARIRVAVNHDYTRDDARLSDGDEVAFFPAVTGG